MKAKANFKDDNFYPQIRRKYFTTIDWFSFVGGILGLFFGFSFLSGVEIIFHIFVGIFRSNWVNRKEIIVNRQRIAPNVRKFREYFQSFLNNSTIHGFGYVSNYKLKVYEK